MSEIKDSILAVEEVASITFLGVPLLTLGIYKLFPTFEALQTETFGFPFPVFVDEEYPDIVVAAIEMVLAISKNKPANAALAG